MKTKLEYIWLDGYYPTQNMKSKTKVVDNFSGELKDCPIWSFDGSSTKHRRPASNADPYKIASRIIKTIEKIDINK